MHHYNPAMSGRRLKSGLGQPRCCLSSLKGTTVRAALGVRKENEDPYVGGLSSLASQPSMSEVIGSFDTTTL